MYTIYGKDSCQFCVQAKTLLELKGLKYKYIDVHESKEARDLFITSGFKTVPQIYKDSEYIGGFTKLKDYLKHELNNDI